MRRMERQSFRIGWLQHTTMLSMKICFFDYVKVDKNVDNLSFQAHRPDVNVVHGTRLGKTQFQEKSRVVVHYFLPFLGKLCEN